MRKQDQPLLVAALAERAVRLAPTNIAAHRQRFQCLDYLDRSAPALAAGEALLALPDATNKDYGQVSRRAAIAGQGARAREILRLAREKFPTQAEGVYGEGWTLLILNAPADALSVFQQAEAAARASATAPTADTVAGLAASRWATGDREGAVREIQRSVAADPEWANKDRTKGWTDAEKKPFLAALAETLRRHPELAPKPPAKP